MDKVKTKSINRKVKFKFIHLEFSNFSSISKILFHSSLWAKLFSRSFLKMRTGTTDSLNSIINWSDDFLCLCIIINLLVSSLIIHLFKNSSFLAFEPFIIICFPLVRGISFPLFCSATRGIIQILVLLAWVFHFFSFEYAFLCPWTSPFLRLFSIMKLIVEKLLRMSVIHPLVVLQVLFDNL